MKKKLLLFIVSLFAFVGNMMAANDIYISEDVVDIMPGKKAAITFYYDADDDAYFKGFQVEFILPKGFKMAPETRLGAALSAHNPELSIRASERDDGAPQPTNVYVGFQVDLTEFPVGEHIELFTCYVSCDENVNLGEYTFTTSRLILGSNSEENTYHATPKSLTLKVIEYEPRTISEDDNEIPEPSIEPEEILVKRTIKANTWSTLTLPFELSGDQAVEIFGDDAEVAEFIDYETDDDDNYYMHFEPISLGYGLMANYPYLIKTSRAINEFQVNDVLVDADEEEAYCAFDNDRAPSHPRYELYATMYGTLHNGVSLPENSFFLRDNKFFISNNSVLKGFRAYFVIVGYSPDNANVSFFVNNEQTTIEGININGNDVVSGNVYNLAGTFLGRAENVMKSLPHGIYIVNHKKVVVR